MVGDGRIHRRLVLLSAMAGIARSSAKNCPNVRALHAVIIYMADQAPVDARRFINLADSAAEPIGGWCLYMSTCPMMKAIFPIGAARAKMPRALASVVSALPHPGGVLALPRKHDGA